MSRTLTAQQRSTIRKQTQTRTLDPSEMSSELNVVPFLDVVMNLIMFLLATSQAVLLLSAIDVQLPSRGAGPTTHRALALSATLTREGIVLAGSGGQLAPGCASMGGRGATTVPRTAAGYDWDALTACASRVKAEFPSEREVIVAADPSVEYEHLVRAMDALRSDGSRALFPDVLLSAGVR